MAPWNGPSKQGTSRTLSPLPGRATLERSLPTLQNGLETKVCGLLFRWPYAHRRWLCCTTACLNPACHRHLYGSAAMPNAFCHPSTIAWSWNSAAPRWSFLCQGLAETFTATNSTPTGRERAASWFLPEHASLRHSKSSGTLKIKGEGLP